MLIVDTVTHHAYLVPDERVRRAEAHGKFWILLDHSTSEIAVTEQTFQEACAILHPAVRPCESCRFVRHDKFQPMNFCTRGPVEYSRRPEDGCTLWRPVRVDEALVEAC